MDLIAAENIVVALMKKHDLHDWNFDFDRAQKRLGACHFSTKKITLSRYFVSAATEEQVRQVAIHEVAHALLPRDEGHGKKWKALAASMGYTGKRTASNPYVAPKNKRRGSARTGNLSAAQLRIKLAYELSASSNIEVKVGDKLMVRDGTIVTIIKRNPTRWKAIAEDGLTWTIPHGMAPALKMQAEAYLARVA